MMMLMVCAKAMAELVVSVDGDYGLWLVALTCTSAARARVSLAPMAATQAATTTTLAVVAVVSAASSHSTIVTAA